MKEQEVFFTKDTAGREYPAFRSLKAHQMFLRTIHEPSFADTTVTVCGEIINPGDRSDLNGFFNRKLRYCGMIEDYQAFHMGNIETLFEKDYLYDLLVILPERDDQILLFFTPGTACQILYNQKLKMWK